MTFLRLILIIGIAALLAACGSNRPSFFVVPSPFQISQPFSADRANSGLVGSITETASIVLEPVEGVPAGFELNLLSEVVGVAQENDIPLSTNVEARAADRLRGSFEAIPSGNQVIGQVNWRFETSSGFLIDTFTTGARMPGFNARGEQVYQVTDQNWQREIAAATATSLAQIIDARPATAARLAGLPGSETIASGPPILVPAVEGAPGDGNISLTRAVRMILTEEGNNAIDPANPPLDFTAAEAHTARGQVSLSDPLPEGGQIITISWDLYAPDGSHLGNIAQENLIEPGSLDGPWGEIAIYAGMGAVEGIMALLSTANPSNTQ